MGLEHNAAIMAAEIGLDPDKVAGMTPPELREAIARRLSELRAARDEDDIAMQVVRVRLGGREYEVRMLPIGKDRAWRARLAEIIAVAMGPRGMLAGAMDTGKGDGKAKDDNDDDDADADGDFLASLIPRLFVDGLDDLVDLFWLYAPDLDRESIEATVPAHDIYTAAMEAFEAFAVPFVRTIVMRMMRLKNLARTP